jgi:hypothetical protein
LLSALLILAITGLLASCIAAALAGLALSRLSTHIVIFLILIHILVHSVLRLLLVAVVLVAAAMAGFTALFGDLSLLVWVHRGKASLVSVAVVVSALVIVTCHIYLQR